jgi:hypothetical protein
MHNRSITIVGDKSRPYEFVNRGGVPNKKAEYAKMQMAHFSNTQGTTSHSCVHHLFYHYMEQRQNNNTESSDGLPKIIPHQISNDAILAGGGLVIHTPTTTNEETTPVTTNCGCNTTCTTSILHRKEDSTLPFTCYARIDYLMTRYGVSVAEACQSAAEAKHCNEACNPATCHG